MDPLSSNAPTRFSYGVPSERRNPRVLSTRNSLQGLFETIGTYGPQIAIALAVRNHDALGTFAATTISNIPRAGSTTGERTITPNTNAGTFAINCDGSGVVTRVAALADGTRVPAFDDFLVTEAVVKNGRLQATTIFDGQRIPIRH